MALSTTLHENIPIFLSYSHFVREHQFWTSFQTFPSHLVVSYLLALNWKHVPNWCFWPKDYFKTSYFHINFSALKRCPSSGFHFSLKISAVILSLLFWRKPLKKITHFIIFLSLVLISFLCNIFVCSFNIIPGFILSRTWYLHYF